MENVEELLEATLARHRDEFPGQPVSREDFSTNGELDASLLIGWWLNFTKLPGVTLVDFHGGVDYSLKTSAAQVEDLRSTIEP